MCRSQKTRDFGVADGTRSGRHAERTLAVRTFAVRTFAVRTFAVRTFAVRTFAVRTARGACLLLFNVLLAVFSFVAARRKPSGRLVGRVMPVDGALPTCDAPEGLRPSATRARWRTKVAGTLPCAEARKRETFALRTSALRTSELRTSELRTARGACLLLFNVLFAGFSFVAGRRKASGRLVGRVMPVDEGGADRRFRRLQTRGYGTAAEPKKTPRGDARGVVGLPGECGPTIRRRQHRVRRLRLRVLPRASTSAAAETEPGK